MASKLRSRAAFTLIELMVVIAIIALLVSILLPSLRQAKELARRVPCMNNEKMLGGGMLMYINTFNQYVPPVYTYVRGTGDTDYLSWYAPDILQPYFDTDAKRATTTSAFGRDSIACTPCDGNYEKNMPRIRYSRRMDCPSIPNADPLVPDTDHMEYSWNVNFKGAGWPWVQNYTGASTLPSWAQIGPGWTPSAIANPRKAVWFKNPSNACPMIEGNFAKFVKIGNDNVNQYWNIFSFEWLEQTGNWSAHPVHLGTFNALMYDGHLEVYTPLFIINETNQKRLPFSNG